ncbi:hypothetical protein F4821DRAFT_229091 [Hypoxylon rubiginosum]|uniref:Uncharacterized protein n=1 Tax=Hypoxylon rubiginosum TaxID=110542 RepID=A0ACC0DCF1_9PEZI|nr:hypothetical protein F4821DRAFT_229091 [Hypoxylon rubiginosum]
MVPGFTWFAAVVISAAVTSAVPDGPQITSVPTLLKDRDIFAINPTSSGQIGINPVTSDLGDPFSYVLTKLGTSNPVVTWDGSVYHYVEGHTNYLTVETVTTTVNNVPSTTTSSVKVSVETAVAGGDTGQEAGALSITFSQDIADNLRKTAEAAIQNCGVVRRKRTDAATCLIEAAVSASEDGGPLEGAASDAFWESIPAEIADNASSILKDLIAVIKSQAQKKKAIIIMGALMAAIALAPAANEDNPLGVVNIPAAGVGSPTSDDGDEDTCPPNKREKSQRSPLCDAPDCQGPENTQLCTVDPNKGCPCLLKGVPGPPQVADKSWWDEQQDIIATVIADPAIVTATADCFVNSNGNAFDGKPAASPASWCVCTSSGTARIYPTLETPSSLCAYAILPSATISPSLTAPHGGSVTSCRIESYTATDTTLKPYCTCNDNSIYPIDTWTDNGSKATGCSATRTTSSSTTTTPPSSTTDQPTTTTTTSSQPTVNEPPPKTGCVRPEDCSDWTCSDGSKPSCDLGAGDPFTHYCLC